MRAIVWAKETADSVPRRCRMHRSAFSLIDVLVSVSVIVVLIGLMMPALTAIRETTRKVICSSNIRQIGLSTAMYTTDYKGQLPFSRNYEKSYRVGETFLPQDLMKARIAWPTSDWDGLGLLFGRQYCSASQVFYCPSHKSNHRFEEYSTGWNGAPIDVFTNFQYRGGNAFGQANLNKIPDRISLLADGMASEFDFNHSVGGNIVASDLSVVWFDDSAHSLVLPTSYDDPAAKDKLQSAWREIDRALYK